MTARSRDRGDGRGSASFHAPGATADEAIHNVRKRFKRVRAVLRLVRGELGARTYKQENEALRDAAAALKSSSGDPGLDAVLSEIELRVEVELAKAGQF